MKYFTLLFIVIALNQFLHHNWHCKTAEQLKIYDVLRRHIQMEIPYLSSGMADNS